MKSSLISKVVYFLTRRQYHFKIVLVYIPDRRNAATNVTTSRTIWLQDRREILDERAIKQALGPGFISGIPKAYKKNGGLDVKEIYYLGWFVSEKVEK